MVAGSLYLILLCVTRVGGRRGIYTYIRVHMLPTFPRRVAFELALACPALTSYSVRMGEEGEEGEEEEGGMHIWIYSYVQYNTLIGIIHHTPPISDRKMGKGE